MDEREGRRSPRFRLVVIAVVVVVVAALAVGASLLVADAEWGWGLGAVLHLVTTGIMLVVSGVAVNFLPAVVKAVWKLTWRDYDEVLDLLRSMVRALRRPARTVLVGSVVAVVLVVAGIVVRPAPTGLEPGELVVMTAFSADQGDARSMLLQQWNRLNPANQARFDYSPVNSDEQHRRMVDDAGPGGGHEADLYVLDVVYMAEFTTRRYIRPLDRTSISERDLGDFVSRVLDTCQRGGELWCLPLNSDVGLLFHRTDLPAASTPQTWDGYFGAAAKEFVASAKSRGATVEAANAAQLSVDDEMLTITALEAIWAAGGLVVGPNGQPALNAARNQVVFGPADLAGIKNLAAASRDADLTLTASDEAKNSPAEVATKAFADGRTAFMRNWPVARNALPAKLAYETIPLPRQSVLGGQNLAVSAHTDKPRAAQALVRFLTNPSSEQILSEVGGFVPTRQSALDLSRRPDAEQIRTALNQARPRPDIANYTEFSRVFREGMARALNNDGRLEAGFPERLAEIVKLP